MPAGIGYGPAGMARLQQLVASGQITPEQARALVPAVMQSPPTGGPMGPGTMQPNYYPPPPPRTPAMQMPPAGGPMGPAQPMPGYYLPTPARSPMADPEGNFGAYAHAIGRGRPPQGPRPIDPVGDVVSRFGRQQDDEMQYQAGRDAMRQHLMTRR